MLSRVLELERNMFENGLRSFRCIVFLLHLVSQIRSYILVPQFCAEKIYLQTIDSTVNIYTIERIKLCVSHGKSLREFLRSKFKIELWIGAPSNNWL